MKTAVRMSRLGIEIGLVVLGLWLGFAEDTGRLVWWCAAATTYLIGSFIHLVLIARRRDHGPWTPSEAPTRFGGFLATFSAFLAASIGASAALTLVITKKFGALDWSLKLLAVWAMVLAWFLVHWGFARIYEYRAHRYHSLTGEDAFRFPDTPVRSIADYTYFSFTIGSSFATSDVEVRSSSVRLWVMTHSILSFFFNGVIIVLAFSTISGS